MCNTIAQRALHRKYPVTPRFIPMCTSACKPRPTSAEIDYRTPCIINIHSWPITSSYRLGEAESRHNLESREQIEVIGQLRQEVVEVTEAFRSQLHSLQEEHQRVVASLREDLDISRNTAARLQQVCV